VPLYKGVFEDKGLELRGDDDDVKIVHLICHGGDLGQVLAAEIARHAVFECLGLAYVDDLAARVLHYIYSRQERQAVCLFPELRELFVHAAPAFFPRRSP